jgi:hypothetical protein
MTRTINIKKFIGLGLLGGLFAFIGIYAIFQTKALAKGVDLVIAGITDGEVVGDETIELSGQAIHANFISINGREIVVDKEDKFSEELILSPGLNIITIEAEDKFDKRTSNAYRIFYKETDNVATTLQ